MHLLVLSAFGHLQADGGDHFLFRVSMHLLVLDDYRLTSPQAAPQRRLFDGNRHGRFTRPDSSANTMSIRPCSRRIPPLNGHASPTVQAPLSAPVFHRPTPASLLLPELSQHSSVHSRPIANNQQTRTTKISAHRSKVDTPKHTAPQGKRSTVTHPILPAADYRLPDSAFPRSCPCVMDAGRLWTMSSAAVAPSSFAGNWQPQSEERMRLMRRPISAAYVEVDIQSTALSSAVTESSHTKVAKSSRSRTARAHRRRTPGFPCQVGVGRLGRRRCRPKAGGSHESKLPRISCTNRCARRHHYEPDGLPHRNRQLTSHTMNIIIPNPDVQDSTRPKRGPAPSDPQQRLGP